jgi:hypothetical protein
MSNVARNTQGIHNERTVVHPYDSEISPCLVSHRLFQHEPITLIVLLANLPIGRHSFSVPSDSAGAYVNVVVGL